MLRLVGELLLTGGVVLALFVGYSLCWTDLIANRPTHLQTHRLRGGWSTPDVPGRSGPAGTSGAAGATGRSGTAAQAPPPVYEAGEGVGLVHGPALGRGYQALIRMGTGREVLA
ncbi:hypothetical protein, partial [Saccharothrix sp. ST-888]|uniref:hypothetical protein n=1 Tax=Saccharothrix sp. ST-888 TaxID=1427391 RepID=UPI000AA822C5